MQSAKLKAISTKHIVLCRESMCAIIALIPSFCEKMAQTYPNDDVSERFKSVSSEFEEHERDLSTKIVSIMKDMMTAHLPDMEMNGVIEKTQVLYRLLAQILQKSDLDLMFERISTMYVEELKRHLSENSGKFASKQSRITLKETMDKFCGSMEKLTDEIWKSFLEYVEKEFDPEDGVTETQSSPRQLPQQEPLSPTNTDKASNFFHKLRFGGN